MKEVLVLGGGGFIGRNIVKFLVNRGDCNVTAADIKEGSNWCEISLSLIHISHCRPNAV